MEDTNHQDNDIGIDHNDNNDSNNNDSDDEDAYRLGGDSYTKNTILDKDTFHRLKQNDASITDIEVALHTDGECFFNSVDWKVDGDCTANNTHLKSLHITYHNRRPSDLPYILGEQGHNLPTREQLQGLFLCIYQNRSIKSLTISLIQIVDEFGGDLIEGLSGHPSLDSLDVNHGKLGSKGCEALGKVLNHPKSILKDLRLPYCKLDDEGLGLLCDGLVGNSTIKRLCLNGNYQITSVGWRALSNVIRHCKLIQLSLQHTTATCFNDEAVYILCSALRGSTVRDLNLSFNNSISSIGWQIIFNQLPHTSIEKLDCKMNKIDDTGLEALASIGTLKYLDLFYNRVITPSGWRSFFNLVQIRGVQLVKLDISENNIGNEGADALGSLLGSMNSLKTLEMTGTSGDDLNGITTQGWVSLFTVLHGSNLDLADLNLNSNSIDDQGIQLLVPLVSRMNSLKRLCLSCNQRATPTGWRALSAFLQSPNFALQELPLFENSINDDTVVAFANALVHNKTLESLDLDGCYDEDDNELITERGWEALSNLVCNETSIMNTYNSNHKLHDLCDDFPDDLVSLLKLNKNKDKVEVARQKILQTHLSREDDDTSKIQELLDMELEMIPSVMAWVGRPIHANWIGTNVSGLSTMFNLLRRLPDLFDSSPQKKPSTGKRKHYLLQV